MIESLSSSFRDPSGFIFRHGSTIYRQINSVYRETFDRFFDSDLYRELVDKGYLLSHEDVTSAAIPRAKSCHRILRPTQIAYISYPYEWCFSQLKDAAMLTLRIQTIALKHGWSLKDASAYNVQFINGRPGFIDLLSFEPYREGEPWVAYRQFCQHFLGPLALMHYVDVGLAKLLVSNIDGVPLDIASRLLPFKTRLNMSLQTHIHLHAKFQSSYSDIAAGETGDQKTNTARGGRKISRAGLQGIIESLASAIRRLHLPNAKTEWGNYYSKTNYSDSAGRAKRDLVSQFLREINEPLGVIQDLGSNTGEFSRVAAPHAKLVVSQDIDPIAVEKNYLQQKEENGPQNVLPLLQDLSAPAPAIGWANAERASFIERAKCDVVMALALIHHLAIGNNVPLKQAANLFAKLGRWLIIEFVPKSDSQVIRMLTTREDIFPNYSEKGFQAAFADKFTVERREVVEGSERILYLMRVRSAEKMQPRVSEG